MTRKHERLRRWVRSVPVPVLSGAALALGHPAWIAAALAWGLGDVLLRHRHEKALDARFNAITWTLARDVDPDLATRALEALVADARPVPRCHAQALLYLGIVRGRGGDLEGALQVLSAVRESRWLEGLRAWQFWLLGELAVLHAARGDLDVAERAIDEARRQMPEAGSTSAAIPEAIVAIRRSMYDEALAVLDAAAAALRKTETEPDPERVDYWRQVNMLRAFARDRAGRPLPAAEVERLATAIRAGGGARLPIERWWPELGAFVERHATPSPQGPR